MIVGVGNLCLAVGLIERSQPISRNHIRQAEEMKHEFVCVIVVTIPKASREQKLDGIFELCASQQTCLVVLHK
jgi:hypothetical protein